MTLYEICKIIKQRLCHFAQIRGKLTYWQDKLDEYNYNYYT